MRRPNKFMTIGMGILGVILIAKNGLGVDLPCFIVGLGYGLFLVLILLGMYSENHDISKLRSYKINFLKRCFGK